MDPEYVILCISLWIYQSALCARILHTCGSLPALLRSEAARSFHSDLTGNKARQQKKKYRKYQVEICQEGLFYLFLYFFVN